MPAVPRKPVISQEYASESYDNIHTVIHDPLTEQKNMSSDSCLRIT